MSFMKKTALPSIVFALVAAMSFQIQTACSETLPDLPAGFKSGTGVIKDDVVYVGLGSIGTDWYKLTLSKAEKKWEKIASFTGTPRDQAASLVLGGKIYVFGGTGKEFDGAKTPSVLTDVYRYDPVTDVWEKLPTRSPRGLAGHVAVTFDGKQAVVFGGVNKIVFDGYFVDLDEAGEDETRKNVVINDYFNKEANDYFFGREILGYDPEKNQWRFLGATPFPGTAGAAAVIEKDSVVLVNGELKPGLRTPSVQQGRISKKSAFSWKKPENLPGPKAGTEAEGLAGAFAGISQGTILVAGGANFPGARTRYSEGHYYAHEGLTKTWNKEIYGLVNNAWTVVGTLPAPLGYGVSLSYRDVVYLIGGETQGGAAVSSTRTLTMNNGKLVVK